MAVCIITMQRLGLCSHFGKKNLGELKFVRAMQNLNGVFFLIMTDSTIRDAILNLECQGAKNKSNTYWYARMTNEENQENKKNIVERAYQQNKTFEDSTQLQKKHTMQEEICRFRSRREDKVTHTREIKIYKYEGRTQKRTVDQNIAKCDNIGRNTICKDLIAMENTA